MCKMKAFRELCTPSPDLPRMVSEALKVVGPPVHPLPLPGFLQSPPGPPASMLSHCGSSLAVRHGGVVPHEEAAPPAHGEGQFPPLLLQSDGAQTSPTSTVLLMWI